MKWRSAAGMLMGLALVGLQVQSAAGQDVAGELSGRVVSQDSAAVSMVEVEASGTSLQQPLKVEANGRGQFRLLSLPVGTYAVRIRTVGYRPIRYEGVVLNPGQTTDLGVVVLEPMTIELQEIVVTAQNAAIDPTTTTSGTTMQAKEFDALPIDRSFLSVVGLAV